MREKSIENKVKDDLITNQCWFHKNQGNLYQKTGVPDFIGCYQGKFFAIETKVGAQHEFSLAQTKNAFDIVRSGGLFVVAYPDYESFLELPKLHIGNEHSDDYMKEIQIVQPVYEKINHDKKSYQLVI